LLRLSPRILRRIAGSLFICLSILAAAPDAARAWQTAHGDPANSGAVDIPTAPAAAPINTIRGLGGVASGVVPVIASDGTLYIGNARGKLMSFSPDGAPGWSREIGFQSIMTAPALGSDGSISLVGQATVRDRTVNPPTVKHVAELHKFNSSGAWVWHVPLPVAGLKVTSASPNILRMNGQDVILVPTIRSGAPFNASLTAFSQDGGVLAHKLVTSFSPTTTSEIDWGDFFCEGLMGGLGCRFTPAEGSPDAGDPLAYNVRVPVPVVAVHTPAAGGVPIVMMSGGYQDLVGLAYTGTAFEERFRVHEDQRFFTSAPLAWPDGHAMLSTSGPQAPSQVVFAGANTSTIRAAGPISFAAPTALGNSRFAIVHRTGGLTIMRGASIETSIQLTGHSIASAAASRNHIFVSTASALHTFDKGTLQPQGSFAWSKGGTSQPVIGPQGHIYAIAGDQLFVFPPLAAVSPPAPQSTEPPQSQSETYKPPLTASNNRLFACEKLDGDDCGKGDYRSIARAFCTKRGFAEADDIKVDSKKVKAETLDGQFCSKNKCKVFERITCRM
jgi:hypothetical protein